MVHPRRLLCPALGALLLATSLAPAMAQVQQRNTARPIVGQEPAQVPPPLPVAEPGDLPVPPDDVPTLDAGRPVAAPLIDDQVTRTAADGPPGQAPAGRLADPFVLPADGLAAGPQSVSLMVEVVAEPFIYLNKETVVKVIVTNRGKTDARDVIVCDVLPDGLEFVDGLATNPEQAGPRLTWTITSIPAGGERVLKYKAKATKVAPIDHSATVTSRTAARTRSNVQQPKLRVEMAATTAKVLKGQPVQFRVTVTNTGTGPAHNVVVQARISNGLSHAEKSRSLDLTIPEIGASQTKALAPLVFDSIAGGMQSCDVLVTSTDVVPDDPATQAAKGEVEVTESKLELSLTGPPKAYTLKQANYKLTVENPGTAPADRVGVAIYIPDGAELVGKPAGSNWNPNDRNLRMSLARVEAKDKQEFTFQVKFGGEKLLRFASKAQSVDGGLSAQATLPVEVQGVADIRVVAEERSGILDVGEVAEFHITIKNVGTKDATNVLVKVEPSKNLQVIDTDHDSDQDANLDKATGMIMFPAITRMAPGTDGVQKMIIRAKTTGDGPASCRIIYQYDEFPKPIETNATARVEALSAPRR